MDVSHDLDVDECLHGLLPITCSLCLHPESRLPSQDEETLGAVVLAKYDGFCTNCGHLIQTGQWIAHLEPSGRWVHEDCL